MRSLSDYCSNLFELADRVEVTDHQNLLLSLDEGGSKVVEILNTVRSNCKKVMVIGNGGSAAIAGHMHNDLSKAAGIRSLSFQDVSLLTALSNDHGYASAYHSGIAQWAETGDLLIAISSSGESENMLLAIQTARKVGTHVLTLTGFKQGNAMRRLGDINYYVPDDNYGYVETLHSLIVHYLTDIVQIIKT